MEKGHVLVVDDEANARTALAELLRDEGYRVEMAADGFKALGKIEEHEPDIVLTDLKMPGMDGLELLRKLRAQERDVVVVVMTAFGAVESAIAAMKDGAADYLTKPINVTELVLVLDREMERRKLRREAGALRARLAERYSFDNIVGSAPVMQEIFKTVAQIAGSRASVLITGESGTGKELIAASIHQRSPRAKGPFVKLHCAALAESLLESELFGHERGSFTGAVGRREGRFAQAHGGTLFLDEIGDLPLELQPKLLRVLQEGEFERVGSPQTISVNVRVIAASNRNLEQAIQVGGFRADLYYRLSAFPIPLPPLRERTEDLPLLVRYFTQRYATRLGKRIPRVLAPAMATLQAYAWPGNVRELENVIQRAVILSQGPHLNLSGWLPTSGPGLRGRGIRTLEELEREHILAVLGETRWQVSGARGAATLLGLKPTTLEARMKKLGIRKK
jgi:two-component system, NtrC family, response regulator AtoC